MLYLSRFLRGNDTADNMYYIVDTDDDKEQEVSFNELRYIVRIDQLNIHGVETHIGALDRYISRCTPYQDKRFITSKIAKAAVLGVEIHLYKDGEITYICVKDGILREGARIRLSDYGKKMYWRSEIRAFGNSHGKHFVLVVDDNIQMLGSYGTEKLIAMKWDISECCDATAGVVYRGLYEVNYNRWASFIIDKPWRMELWRQKYLAERAYD